MVSIVKMSFKKDTRHSAGMIKIVSMPQLILQKSEG